MKQIRDIFLGFIMIYKTSFAVNPVITTLGTIIGSVFVYSIAKIFGL